LNFQTGGFKLSITMKKNFLFIYFLVIIMACTRDEPTPISSRPPELVFDPQIENFEGVPGDELRLVVKIEGESGFTLLVLEKLKNDKVISKDTLDYSTEPISTPYVYDYRTTLHEEDIDNDFQLKFIVTYQEKIPGGSTMFGSHFMVLNVHVLSSD
jgi:Fe-S cluster assembly iron-binding protein IscA